MPVRFLPGSEGSIITPQKNLHFVWWDLEPLLLDLLKNSQRIKMIVIKMGDLPGAQTVHHQKVTPKSMELLSVGWPLSPHLSLVEVGFFGRPHQENEVLWRASLLWD